MTKQEFTNYVTSNGGWECLMCVIFNNSYTYALPYDVDFDPAKQLKDFNDESGIIVVKHKDTETQQEFERHLMTMYIEGVVMAPSKEARKRIANRSYRQ